MTLEDLREDRRPAELWYWGDWFSSFDVRACSLAARGLWVDLLGIMSRGQIKGALIINGSKPDSKTLAKIVGASEREIEARLNELERHSVFSRLEDGTIINRRMYRASQLSKKRAEAGRLGGLSSKQKGSKPESKTKASLEIENEDEDESKKEGGVGETEIDRFFDEFWAGYPKEGRFGKAECRRKFAALFKAGKYEEFRRGIRGYMDFLKAQRVEKNFEQRPMYAKTLLNGRWEEYVDYEYRPPL